MGHLFRRPVNNNRGPLNTIVQEMHLTSVMEINNNILKLTFPWSYVMDHRPWQLFRYRNLTIEITNNK